MTTFFVGGAQRSGTTLLQGLLCSGETTNPLIRECFALEHLIGVYRRGRYNFEEIGAAYFTDVDAFKRFYARAIGDFLEQTRARYAPAEHLVLKETLLTRAFHDLFDLVPDAKFVVSVRDPRDVVASLIRVGEKLPEGNANRWFAERDMVRLAQYYRSFYKAVLAAPHPVFREHLLFVKYEDLVANPDRELDRLVEFTGLKIDLSDELGPWQRNQWDFDQLAQSEIGGWKSELWGKEVSAKNIGKFRETLTDAEIATLENECADVFHIFGYQKSDGTAPVAETAGEHS